MMDKPIKILVDFDDTLISFSEMFCDRWNILISQNRFNSFKEYKITLDDITDYNLLTSLRRFYSSKGISTDILQSLFSECIEYIKNDEHFYDNPYLTPEYFKIFDFLQRQSESTKITLHTKVLSLQMIQSKINYIKGNKDFKIFDEIIFQYEKNLQEPKNYNYDIMIDDAPNNIKHFLEYNLDGKVWMPLRSFNKHLKQYPRLSII